MGKMYKLSFVKEGQEFELPEISIDSDIQTTIDLMKMKMRIEKETAKDLGLDYKEAQRELLKLRMDDKYELPWDVGQFNSISSIQMNLETANYILHKIDPGVTREMISKMGASRLANLVLDIFGGSKKEEGDFPKATEDNVAP